MFQTFVVQPIFNLLVFIYAIIPGHNFGLAIILFTIIIRLLMWPLVKKQIRQAKITRKLQPELKRIKKEAKGDRQKESMMMMELYKERGANPLSTLPVLIIQMIILIGLYSGLIKVIRDPNQLIQFAYGPIQQLPWMQHLASAPQAFDETLFGLVDLSRSALSSDGVYWAALLIVLASAAVQFLTSRQLMPVDKDARKLRHILRDAGNGKSADQTEVNAAVGRSTQYIIPVMVLLFTVNIASALSLYWLTGGIVAYIQQWRALKDEEEDLEKAADEPLKGERGSKISYSSVDDIPEAEVVTSPKNKKQKTKTSKKATKKRKRR